MDRKGRIISVKVLECSQRSNQSLRLLLCRHILLNDEDCGLTSTTTCGSDGVEPSLFILVRNVMIPLPAPVFSSVKSKHASTIYLTGSWKAELT